MQEGDPLNHYIPKEVPLIKGDLLEESSVEVFCFCRF